LAKKTAFENLLDNSTLFNCFSSSRYAVISAYPGTTRDRQYGEVRLHERRFIIIDTGGITDEQDEVGKLITQQAQQAIQDADKILFVVDGRSGITPEDKMIVDMLRRSKKPVTLAVNKVEGQDPSIAVADAYELGIKTPIAISAAHNGGMATLIEKLFPEEPKEDTDLEDNSRIRLAIVGRANVGKSTLTNRMLGEERVIVHDSPGTTRDSIFVPLERFDQHYMLIDTAGMLARDAVLKKNYPEAEKQLTWVMNHSHIASLRQIARLRLARVLLTEQNPEQS